MEEAIYLELFQYIERDIYLEILMNSGRVIHLGRIPPTAGITNREDEVERVGTIIQEDITV